MTGQFNPRLIYGRAIFLLVLGIALEIFHSYYIAGFASEISTFKQEIQKGQGEIEQLKSICAEKSAFLKKIESVSEMIQESVFQDKYGNLTTPFNPERFLLLNLFDSQLHEISFQVIQFEKIKKFGSLLTQDVVLKLRGEYPKIAKFIREVESGQNRFIKIAMVNEISSSGSEAGMVQGSIRFRIYFNQKGA